MKLQKLLFISLICLGLSVITVNTAQAQKVPDGFSELAKRLSPAVVNISTAQTVEVSDEDVLAFPKGSPLERFNDFFGGRRGGNGGSVSQSLGSGFVIDKEGFIVTNNHVIEGADLIEVTFPDGDTYQADLIGRDPSTDIALLKIEAGENIPFVNFGDEESGQVGEWVIAIGNPFGFGSSVSAGIISARNRSIGNTNYDDFIQSDVAINKGNSGGPLFNMAGDVVGVNTAIFSPSGYSVGISFSVPADLANSVAKQLREYGETRRGRLGVNVQEVDKGLAASYGLDTPHGAIVRRVVDDSPAKKAGLQRGDLIVELAGERVEGRRQLFRSIAEAEIDADLEITVIRKGKRKTLTAVIERLEEEVTKQEREAREREIAEADQVAIGIHVEAINDEARSRYRIAKDVTGVRVVKVDKTAEASGKIREGDIIEEVAFEKVDTPKDFEAIIEQSVDSERPITILVNRRGNYLFYSFNAET